MFNETIVPDGTLIPKNSLPERQTPRLLDQVRNVIRCKHYPNVA